MKPEELCQKILKIEPHVRYTGILNS